MILMKQIIEVTLRPSSLLYHNKPYDIVLRFTKIPTKEQLERATMYFLTENDYGSETGLMFMNLVRNQAGGSRHIGPFPDGVHGDAGVFC